MFCWPPPSAHWLSVAGNLPAVDATIPGGGDETGEVQFELAVAPTGAQCIRVVAAPPTGSAITRTFSVTGGSFIAGLSLGVLPAGTIAFSGDAFTAACSAIGSATAGWTADPLSATIRSGVVTNITLTFRPRNPVGVGINFVRNIAAVIASGSTSAALTDGPPLIWGQSHRGLEYAHGVLAPDGRHRVLRGICSRLHRPQGRLGLVLGPEHPGTGGTGHRDRNGDPGRRRGAAAGAGDAGDRRRPAQLRLRHVAVVGLLLGSQRQRPDRKRHDRTAAPRRSPFRTPAFRSIRALSAGTITPSRPPPTATTSPGV